MQPLTAILLAAAALGGLACSAASTRAVPAPVSPPPVFRPARPQGLSYWAPGADSVDVPGSVFTVAGRSAVDLGPQIQSAAVLEDESNSLFAYLGTRDEDFARAQLLQPQRAILSRVARRARSLLQSPSWEGRHLLLFEVVGVDFWDQTWTLDNGALTDVPRPQCIVQLSLQLVDLERGLALMGGGYPIVVQVRKEHPGGRQTADPVWDRAADAICQVLDEYVARSPGPVQSPP
ncbi:MAG: hypothetical protein ABIL09_13275 [Gemmatimonadota bacterium]